jgi:hypothetical protein
MSRIYIVQGGKFIRSKSFVQLKTFCVNVILVDGCLMDTAYEIRMNTQRNEYTTQGINNGWIAFFNGWQYFVGFFFFNVVHPLCIFQCSWTRALTDNANGLPTDTKFGNLFIPFFYISCPILYPFFVRWRPFYPVESFGHVQNFYRTCTCYTHPVRLLYVGYPLNYVWGFRNSFFFGSCPVCIRWSDFPYTCIGVAENNPIWSFVNVRGMETK